MVCVRRFQVYYDVDSRIRITVLLTTLGGTRVRAALLLLLDDIFEHSVLSTPPPPGLQYHLAPGWPVDVSLSVYSTFTVCFHVWNPRVNQFLQLTNAI